MNKATGFLLALLVAVGCTQTAGHGPLSVDRLVCDFGIVPDSTTVLEHTFTLTNTGRDTLRILRVDTSCGCTTAELSARELAPGEQARLHAVLSINLFADHVDKNVALHVEGQAEPVVLHLVADKLRNLADPARYPYAPDGPVHFTLQMFFAGYVAQGDVQEVSLLMYNGSDQPVRLRRRSFLPRYLRLQLPGTVEPGSIGRLTATFDMRRARRLFGEYSHEVVLTDGLGHRLPLQLYCIVTEKFRPEDAPFPRMLVPYFQQRMVEADCTGGPVEKSFRILNTGTGTLHIRRVQPLQKGLEARLEPESIAPGQEGRLVLTVPSAQLESAQECGITVNDPKQPYAVFTILPVMPAEP